jgi:hypothetical protein
MKKYFYRDPLNGRILADRRSGIDRRNGATVPGFFRLGPRRRKRAGRRVTDLGGYVDSYDSRTWGIAIAVLLLSLMDALLTGLHLHRGSARELNPIMNAVLNRGGLGTFFGVKVAMTVFPMAIILLHKEWALGRYAARLCLWAYIMLSIYHLYLAFGLQKLGGFFPGGIRVSIMLIGGFPA